MNVSYAESIHLGGVDRKKPIFDANRVLVLELRSKWSGASGVEVFA